MQENKGDYICVVLGPVFESETVKPHQQTPQKTWDMETDFLADLDSSKSKEREQKMKIMGSDTSVERSLVKRGDVNQSFDNKLLYLKIYANV